MYHSTPRLRFRPASSDSAGFELLPMAELVQRVEPLGLDRDHRTEFHSLTHVRAGTGHHVVDFQEFSCPPGTLLWVRPGQVQRFDHWAGVTAEHFVFTSDFPLLPVGHRGLLAEPFGPTVWHLAGAAGRATTRACGYLAQESGNADADPDVLSLLLGALLVTTAALPRSQLHDRSRPSVARVAALHAAMEVHLRDTREVAFYARVLNCSSKTLNRATTDVLGRSCKQVINDRVALEARRLLAHTDVPVAVIGRSLGFGEATNFVKFVRRETGSTPSALRAGGP